MNKAKFLWRPFKYFIVINIIILAASNVYFYLSLRNFHVAQSAGELSSYAKVFNIKISDFPLDADNIKILNELTRKAGDVTGSRITIIDVFGNILGDTLETPGAMENHISRKEIAEALKGQTGTDIRKSFTTKQKTLYVAEPIFFNGEIIGVSRAARTIEDIDDQHAHMLWKIVFFYLLALAILMAISYGISRHYTKPLHYIEQKARDLAAGRFGIRVTPPKVSELKVLADSFNYMAATIEDRMQTIIDQHNNLNIIINSMTDALLAIGADETIAKINSAAASWFNISSENALGRDLREVVRYKAMQDFMLQALKSHEPLVSDAVLRSGDGNEYTLRLKSNRLNNEDVNGCVVVFYDVTQIRKIEKMRRDFVSNVSHEIRTPLAAIQISAEALGDSGLLEGHAEQQFVTSIRQHTERLDNLVNDLLLLSRIEQYPEEFTTEKMTLKPILQKSVDGLKTVKYSGQIKIICDEALVLELNPRLIELALMNLIDNAFKYSPADADMEVSAIKKEGFVQISVKDHGDGIPPQHLPRLFERFYRVDTARSRQTGGTGLGLAIVKHIALAHKGYTEVQSSVGEGSIFSIILPIL